MKRLYLLRHAHAENDSKGGDDHARNLSENGRNEAKYIADKMAELGYKPEVIYASDAARTRQTADIVASTMQKNPTQEYCDKLYLATPYDMLHFIHEKEPEADSIMLVAHNPGMHQLARSLYQKGDENLREAIEFGYPPATLTVYEVDITQWNQLAPAKGEILNLLMPN